MVGVLPAPSLRLQPNPCAAALLLLPSSGLWPLGRTFPAAHWLSSQAWLFSGMISRWRFHLVLQGLWRCLCWGGLHPLARCPLGKRGEPGPQKEGCPESLVNWGYRLRDLGGPEALAALGWRAPAPRPFLGLILRCVLRPAQEGTVPLLPEGAARGRVWGLLGMVPGSQAPCCLFLRILRQPSERPWGIARPASQCCPR